MDTPELAPVRPSERLSDEQQYDSTPAQYDALNRLTANLSVNVQIPMELADRYYATRTGQHRPLGQMINQLLGTFCLVEEGSYP